MVKMIIFKFRSTCEELVHDEMSEDVLIQLIELGMIHLSELYNDTIILSEKDYYTCLINNFSFEHFYRRPIKLRARWTPELVQEWSAFHNIDAESELIGLLSENTDPILNP